MKSGTVNYSTKNQKGLRFDASFHLSEGLLVKRKIASLPYEMLTIKDVSSDIFYGNRAKRVYVSKRDKGIPFLSSSDILQADLENVKLASKKYTPCIEQMALKKGWTLISRSGTIGNCAFANAKHAQKLASEDVIRLVPNNILRGGLVFAYLASSHGHALLTQGTFGAVIQHIEPNFIASLPIPKFPIEFQNEVDDLVQKSAKNRENAAESLKLAIDMFESEIGNSFVNLGYNSKIISSRLLCGKFKRFDSQYQIGKEELNKYDQTIKVGEVKSKIFIGNRGKRMYVKNGVPFLSSSDMMLANPLRFCKYISRSTPALSDMKVSYKDILISRSGTVGNTIIVGKSLSGIAVSEHAMRLVIDPEKMNPEYVFAYLMTQHGQDTLHTLPYGSVIVTLGEEFLADIDIPIIDRSKMESIVKMISSYMNHLDDAIANENKAIRMVEEEIEKWNN